MSAATEALMRGASHVSFRGFCVDAVRIASRHVNDPVVRVELVVWFDGHIVECERVEGLPPHMM